MLFDTIRFAPRTVNERVRAPGKETVSVPVTGNIQVNNNISEVNVLLDTIRSASRIIRQWFGHQKEKRSALL